MSIDHQIEQAVAAGLLHFLPLFLPSDASRRVLLVHSDLLAPLSGGWTTEEEERRFNRLQGDLEMFVTGGVISMGLKPYEHGDAYMGLLDPAEEGTFDIRSRDPNPGIRVFGRFAKEDTFVAFCHKYRSATPTWSDQRPLGNRNSLEYQFAMLEVIEKWEVIFPGNNPIRGDDWHDYITEDAFLVGD